jgi:indole-3-glycerol phosphate synthase
MILEQIVQAKRQEVAARKAAVPLGDLKARIRDLPSARDFHRALDRRSQGGGIRLIAEVKRASPSQGVIREGFDLDQVIHAYVAAGAAALSVLTDEPFFQGHLDDLARVKARVSVPVLRKDFIIDPYQVYETRAWGADAVLLIVAALETQSLQDLLALSQEVGLYPLTEVHTRKELQTALGVKVPIVGINNRDLNTFQVSLETTFALLPEIPPERVIVSESGISDHTEVTRLEAAGVDAILVGEGLLRAQDVEGKARDLLGMGRGGSG